MHIIKQSEGLSLGLLQIHSIIQEYRAVLAIDRFSLLLDNSFAPLMQQLRDQLLVQPLAAGYSN